MEQIICLNALSLDEGRQQRERQYAWDGADSVAGGRPRSSHDAKMEIG